MLAVLVDNPNWRQPRRLTYPEQSSITIGRFDKNGLVLVQKGIEQYHARVCLSDGELVIVDFKTKLGTWVNERRIESTVVLRPTDNVRIGSFTLLFEHIVLDTAQAHGPYIADHPIEKSLLHAIGHRDETSRIIYADWLEQQGHHVRAEFLRVQDKLLAMRPGDAERAAHASRLGALAAKIDVAWKILVANPAVESCGVEFRFRCPMQWSMLQATERDGVRHCTGCKRDVYYALNVGEARTYAKDGHCVALDVTSTRWRDDLAEPFEELVCEDCEMDIGHAYDGDECPRCHRLIERNEFLGEIDIA
jgi:uncharacterized protein (TIGR02996 family)